MTYIYSCYLNLSQYQQSQKMRQLAFIIGSFFIFCTTNIIAQNADSLSIRKANVYKNNIKLSKEEINTLLTQLPNSEIEYQKYKTKKTIASGALIIGGGFLLYTAYGSLNNAINDKNNLSEGNLKTSDQSELVFPAIAALTFTSVGAILAFSARDNLIKSVQFYNSNTQNANNGKKSLEFIAMPTGVSLVFKF